MSASLDISPSSPRGGDVLTIGFGTTVAMWAIGYVTKMPLFVVSPMLIAGLLLAALLVGGFVAGRSTRRGWSGGLLAGFITAALNLLIVGAVISGKNAAADAPSPLTWAPGTLFITAIIMSLAAAVGSRFRAPSPAEPRNWTGRFALVAMIAVGLLLIAGGLVTGHEAGLAVPDWPRTYHTNMFLYPLARMTGNIYYEHAHRLYGALVGLTTIVLAMHLCHVDRRRWVKALALLAIVAVVAQGVMGAARVLMAHSNGGVEVATAANETDASIALRIIHGVFAQIFFALMVTLAVVTSRAWRTATKRTLHHAAGVDRWLSVSLFAAMIVQLILGAVVRHTGKAVFEHISMASAVFLLAVITGMRAWGVHGEADRTLKRLGIAMALIVCVQVGLGIAALVVINMSKQAGHPVAADPIVTTLHQANGAALLAVTTAMMLFSHRFLAPDPHGKTEHLNAAGVEA